MASSKLNIRGILNNVLLQPLTQQNYSHSLTFQEPVPVRSPAKPEASLPKLSPEELEEEEKFSKLLNKPLPPSPTATDEEFLRSLQSDQQNQGFISILPEKKSTFNTREDELLDYGAKHFPSLEEEKQEQEEQLVGLKAELAELKKEPAFAHFFPPTDDWTAMPSKVEISREEIRTLFHPPAQLKQETGAEDQSEEELRPQIHDTVLQRMNDYSQVQDLMKKVLQLECLRNSGSLDEGMKNIRDIVAEMGQIRNTISSEKATLRGFRQDLGSQLMKVTLLKLKKERFQKVAAGLKVVKEFKQKLEDPQAGVNAFIQNRSYFMALLLIRKLQTQIKSKFISALGLAPTENQFVYLVDKVKGRLVQAEQAIWKLLRWHLKGMAEGKIFSADIYHEIVKCYLLCSPQKGSLKENLQQFLKQLSFSFQIAIKQSISFHVERFKKVGSLPNGSMDPALINHLCQAVFKQLAEILFNHHQVLRFHTSNSLCKVLDLPGESSELDSHIKMTLMKSDKVALVQTMDQEFIKQVLSAMHLSTVIAEQFTLNQLIDFLNQTAIMIRIFYEQIPWLGAQAQKSQSSNSFPALSAFNDGTTAPTTGGGGNTSRLIQSMAIELPDYVKQKIIGACVERFSTSQYMNLVEIVEQESLERLPLPKDFDLMKELY